jgi:S-DNA-T family DNA segregation ATPase FtsK/SpoIIIE
MKKTGKRKKFVSGVRKGKPLPQKTQKKIYFLEVFQIFVLAFSIYLILAFFTPWSGEAGSVFSHYLIDRLGATAYFLPLLPIMVLVFWQDPARKPLALHLSYLAGWLASIAFFFDIVQMGGSWQNIVKPVVLFLGAGGSLVLAWALLAVTTLFVLNFSFVRMMGFVLRQTFRFTKTLLMKLKRLGVVFASYFHKKQAVPLDLPEYQSSIMTETNHEKCDSKLDVAVTVLDELHQEINTALQKLENAKEFPNDIAGELPLEALPADSVENPSEKEMQVSAEPMTAGEAEVPEPKETEPEKPSTPSISQASSKVKFRENAEGGYQLPRLNLLEEAEPRKEKNARIEPENYSKLLEETLLSFGISAKVVHVERGPTVTRYELQPAKGVKVSKITALSDDLALALAAMSLRIEAPIPGKSAIGIEIPNSSVAMVYFRDLLSHPIYQESPLKTILALGKDITGKPIFTDLRRMPHLLIAGATGSGKTVCINTLIASILFKATPKEVQFVMIDPKRVELTIYDGIPHLIQEVVTDPKQASKVLVDVLAIMDERYNLFKETRVRNLEEYNKACPAHPLPYIVVLIDELADLMMLSAATVESSIARLTALARAAGIHLIVATQRPSVDVITGIIKANIPSRIAFAVSSIADSRTILDTGGAEKLLGRGDMLFAPIDAMKPIRLQGAYVGLSEIEALVSFWSRQPSPENLVKLPQIQEEENLEEAEDDGDELYAQAKEIILRTGQASVSTLQRKLKIGYARAGRLMDLMEKRGVVGPAEGSKPRKILIPNPFRQGN